MKSARILVVVVALLGMPGLAGEANATTLLGSSAAKNPPGSLTMTLQSGAAVGQTVVVWHTSRMGGNVAINDSQANAWSGFTPGASWVDSDIFWAVVANPLVAGDTITVTYQGGMVTPRAAAMEAAVFDGLTGFLGASARSQAATNKGSKTPSVTVDGSLGVAAAMVGVLGPMSDGFTPDAGWVTLPRIGTSGGNPESNVTLAPAFKIVTEVGSQIYAPTLGTARQWNAAAIVLSQPDI